MHGVQSGLSHHIEKLRRYAFALVGSRSEADELIHDSLTRALSRIATGSAVQDPQEYLFSILHEVRTEQLRSNRLFGSSDAASGDSSDGTHIANASFDRHDFPAALAALPEETRRVVLLVGFAGFGYQDAATVLGVSVKTVMSRLAIGREALRRTMMRDSGHKGGDLVHFPSRRTSLARLACSPIATAVSS